MDLLCSIRFERFEFFSPSGVRDDLIRAGLWQRILDEHKEEKRKKRVGGVVAHETNKTVTSDLFLIPVPHKADEGGREGEEEKKEEKVEKRSGD